MSVHNFTARQAQVFSLMAQAKTIREIAEELGISYWTAREHVLNVKHKLVNLPETLQEEAANPSYVIETVNEKTAEEVSDFEKQQVSYWKKQYNNLKTTSELEEEILRIFTESFEAYTPVKYLANCNAPKSTGTSEELVLLLSDFHAGEEVNPTEMLGMNEYNMDIMFARVQKIYTALDSILNKMSGYTYKKINIFALGDMVSGIIHEELLQGTCTVDQVVMTAEILSEMVYKLSQRFEEVEFIGVVGNHGRFNKAPNFKKKYNNFDYLLYKMIEAKCCNLENVYFNIPKAGIAVKKIFEWNFLLMHGDGINSFGGIPFYGIRRTDAQISQLLTVNKDFYPHYVCMGHFHTTNIMEKIGGKIIMNGTLKGGDEYALGKMFTGGDAKQLLLSIHPKHGLTWEMSLNLA